MAKLDKESLYSLHMYSQFIEILSQELLQFLEHGVSKQHEQKKISDEDAAYFENVISSKLDHHNDILSKIEKEISSRVRKRFPNVISLAQLKSLGQKLDVSIKEHETSIPKNFN